MRDTENTQNGVRRLTNSLVGRFAGQWVLVRFSASSTVFSLAGMVGGFLILRWVAPEQMGLWQSLLLVETYAVFVQAGVFNGLNRELPFRLGKGDSEAMDLVSTGQGFAIVIVALFICGAVASFFVSSDPAVRFALPAVFIAVASAIYQQFLGATYRAKRAFERLSVIYMIDGVASLATLPVVYLLGYPGLPIRYVILALVAAGTRHRWRPYRVPTRLNLHHLGALLKVGVPLYSLAYLVNASNTFPRVILLSQGSLEMVGLFAPASAMITLMYMVPRSIANYIYPQMSFRFGETGDSRVLWPTAWKASVGFMTFAVPILILGVLIVPPLIRAFIPEYAASVGAVRWTLVSGLFLGASISVSALNSLKAWRWMAVYTAAQLALSYVGPLLGFHLFSDHIAGVAFGYAMGMMACFFVGLFSVYWATMRRGGAT